MLDVFEERIVSGFQRHFENIAFHVVEPTMIATTEPALLDASVFQRSATMAATKKQQTRTSLAVAKSNQVFAKNAHTPGDVLELRR